MEVKPLHWALGGPGNKGSKGEEALPTLGAQCRLVWSKVTAGNAAPDLSGKLRSQQLLQHSPCPAVDTGVFLRWLFNRCATRNCPSSARECAV